MKEMLINLNSVDNVKKFTNLITKYDSEFDIVSGRYIIDGKSIMGIFSLDLSKPLTLRIYTEGTEDNEEELLEALAQFKA